MFSIDVVQVATLWCIAGVGIICAMNARGFLRQVVSWLIAIAIVTVAFSFSFLKYESVKHEIGLSETRNVHQNAFVPDSNSRANSTAAEAASDSASTSYLSAEKQMMESILEISDSILSFPEWKTICSQGIEKREIFESKALSLRNRSMNSYRQIRSLSPPGVNRESYDFLLAAADNMRLAGYQVHYQFALEADIMGESIAKAREHANQAKSSVSFITNINNKE